MREIAAVGNGNPLSVEPFQADRRKLFFGKAMLILRTIAGREATFALSPRATALRTEKPHVTQRCKSETSQPIRSNCDARTASRSARFGTIERLNNSTVEVSGILGLMMQFQLQSPRFVSIAPTRRFTAHVSRQKTCVTTVD